MTSRIPIPYTRIAVLIIGTALAFFIFFTTVTSVGQLDSILRSARSSYILLAILIILPTPLLSTVRWYAVLRAIGHHFPFWRIARITMASMAFIAIPGRLGDFVRTNPLRQEIPITRTTATIILEKILDIAVLWWFSAIGFALLGRSLISLGATGAGCAALLAVMLGGHLTRLTPKGKISEKISAAGQAFGDARTRPTWILIATLASAMNWTTSLVSTWLIFQAFGGTVPMAAVLAYIPIAIFAGLIPLGIAGTGTRDGAFLALFSIYTTSSVILATSIAYTALGYVLFTIIALPFLRHLKTVHHV